ncbi:MAG: hypothetical protein OXI08_05115 [Cyanobacteria bacterium MAG IRC4_bin_6]|nr:hypothetical protein [Cyanobacteria bacterium MAG IRC4_bin_6]
MLVDAIEAARLEPEKAQVLIGFGDPPSLPDQVSVSGGWDSPGGAGSSCL